MRCCECGEGSVKKGALRLLSLSKIIKRLDELPFRGKATMLTCIPYNKKVYGELVSFVKKLKPDVTHIHNIFPLFSPAVYAALNHAGIPVVQTHHNFRMLCPNGPFFVVVKFVKIVA